MCFCCVNIKSLKDPDKPIQGVMSAKWELTSPKEIPLAVAVTTQVDTSGPGGAGLDLGLVSDVFLLVSWREAIDGA